MTSEPQTTAAQESFARRAAPRRPGSAGLALLAFCVVTWQAPAGVNAITGFFNARVHLDGARLRDRAATPHPIPRNAATGFPSDFTPVDISYVKGTLEPLGPSSRKTGLVLSEIMCQPARRYDGRVLEFVELYNSNPFFEDITGYRLSGSIGFTFPPGTVLPGKGFLLAAKSPPDFTAVYGLTNVVGPYSGNLKPSGLVQLCNAQGAVYLEVPYSNQPPWPIAADGTGHSLVLLRPSYGEADPRAWGISDLPGGSPGQADARGPDALWPVVINEFLAQTNDPQQAFIELFNYSTQAVDLSGAFLSNEPDTNKFRIPNGTILPATGFVAFNQAALGFPLSAAGESVFLVSSNQTHVIDAVSFGPQANGVSTGRFPDGAPDFFPLRAPTPGQANSPRQPGDVVINELMYRPISGNDDDQYIELFSAATNAVRLDAWRFTAGVSFTFPTNTTLPAGGYLVVARNLTNLFAHYPNLSPANAIGNFAGRLSPRGARVALGFPETVVSTNATGRLKTNRVYVTVDEVTYGIGGRWGRWAHGGGSSLELIDPHSNHRLAPNWADSDETHKAPWTTLEASGMLDNGADAANALEVSLLNAGECLLDDVSVTQGTNPTNHVANPDFESGLGHWQPQGDQIGSSLETTEGYNSRRSLHIRATARGDSGANRIRADLTSGLSPGQTGTIRAEARWLRGWPEILLRLHGNWLEATGSLTVPPDLGTPGARNSTALANAGPAIYDVTHSPALPAASQPVTVIARVDDPDGLAALNVRYRLDPSTNLATAPMTYRGAGFYTATLPGQPAGALVAFHLEATDAATPPVTTRFPSDAPRHECLVRFGETLPRGDFGTYRLWLTQANQTAWINRPVLSNEPIDGTFVYGDWRIIYNMGARYAGSPYHQNFNSPIGNPCHYSFDMPDDDQLLGTSNFNKLHDPGNDPGDDYTLQREQTAYWMARQLGLPWNYRRYVYFFVNGVRRGQLMEDTQVPGGDVVNEDFPNDNNGHLYKLQPWFEFSYAPSGGMGFNNESWCTLLNFYTTDGARKLARYRWNWLVRTDNHSANDYTNVFALTDAANTPANGPYTANLENQADMEQWLRTFAICHATGNWDSFGDRNAQNMYAYKPTRGPWSLLIWDFNIVLGNSGSDGPTGDNLFQYNTSHPDDTAMGRIYANPPFRRAYWRALEQIANGPMVLSNVAPVLDAKYAAFQTNRVSATSPAGVKTWIASRRTYLLQQLKSVAAAFTITSNGGADFTTNRNLVTLTGTAPVEVKTIRVNGTAYPLTWTTVNSWRLAYPLAAPVTTLSLKGYDLYGIPLTNATASVTVSYTGPLERPEDHVVINEIMYHPHTPDAEFLELYNNSTNTAFDLSRDLLRGIGFTFPDGTVILPGAFLVVIHDPLAFTAAYGSSIPVAGVFNGRLDNAGETLTLIQPGPTPAQDLTLDQVRYDHELPWPVAADGAGPSLQLIDASQDNRRVANWAAAYPTPGAPNSTRASRPNFPPLYLNEIEPNNLSGPTDHTGQHQPWIEIYNAGPTAVALTGFYLTDDYTNLARWRFPTGAQVRAGQRLVVWADGRPYIATDSEWHTSFRLNPTNGSVALVFTLNSQPAVLDYLNYNGVGPDRSIGDWPEGQPITRQIFQFPTPGATNNPASIIFPVVINEWMAANTVTLLDPADGQSDDWFELYNNSDQNADLSGYSLTDDLAQPFKWAIPPGTVLGPRAFRLVWADNEPSQNGFDQDLHASFRLSKQGSALGLFAPDGSPIDSVTFGPQIADVSQGRYPDGAPNILSMTYPTPGAPNFIPTTNHPPLLQPIPDQTINAGQRLILTAAANDPDPGQTLAFTLDPGAPADAQIDPNSGVFVWTPAQAPATNHFTVRVTDNGAPPLSASQSFAVTVTAIPLIRFAGIRVGPDANVVFAWTAQSGLSYRVQYKDNLDDPAWNDLIEVTADGDTVTFVKKLEATRRFYRVVRVGP